MNDINTYEKKNTLLLMLHGQIKIQFLIVNFPSSLCALWEKGTICADAGRCDAEASNHLKLFSHTTNKLEYNFI